MTFDPNPFHPTPKRRRPRAHHAAILAHDLRATLDARGWTVQDLANATGVMRSQISMLLSGQRTGTYAQWTVLMDAAHGITKPKEP